MGFRELGVAVRIPGLHENPSGLAYPLVSVACLQSAEPEFFP